MKITLERFYYLTLLVVVFLLGYEAIKFGLSVVFFVALFIWILYFILFGWFLLTKSSLFRVFGYAFVLLMVLMWIFLFKL